MTTWPSGLRRVTRNHFSSGGVGSNPAVVVFLFATFPTFSFYPFSFIPLFFKKLVLPRFELGSLEPESNMLPLHHRTMILLLLFFYPLWHFLLPLYKTKGTTGFEPVTTGTAVLCSTAELCALLFLFFFFSLPSCPPLFFLFFYKKTPPVGLEPTTLRLKAARSTDWARKALAYLISLPLSIYPPPLFFLSYFSYFCLSFYFFISP